MPQAKFKKNFAEAGSRASKLRRARRVTESFATTHCIIVNV